MKFTKVFVCALTAVTIGTTTSVPLTPWSYSYAQAASLFSEPILHLLFEGNVTDSSIAPLNTTAVGNPAFVEGRMGQGIKLLKNGSVKQYIDLGNPSALQFGTDTNFTIAFWIKSPGNTSDPAVISNKNWNSGGNTGYAIVLKEGTLGWNYKTTDASRMDANIPNVADGSWHHIAISHDRTTGRADFYKDGEPVQVSIGAGSYFDNNTSAMNIEGMKGSIDSGLNTMIGNDGTGNYGSELEVTLDDVRIIPQAVTAQEVKDIYDLAPPIITLPEELEAFKGSLNLIGAKQTIKGAKFRYNLDLRTPEMSTKIDKMNVELAYDKDLFEFVSASNTMKVDSSVPGTLKLELSGGKVYNQSNPLEYAKSRVSELTFAAKAAEGKGQIEVVNGEFYKGTTKFVTEQLNKQAAEIQINPKAAEDRNLDGHITIGDVALAQGEPEEVLAGIADKVKYQPYKRVVVIGIDGGAASITPDAPYWETPSSTKEVVGDRLSIPNIRSIVEKGAASYTAQATLPSSSSPNWGAMINGVDFSKHLINNDDSAKYTYSETSPYPSVFKKLRAELPATKLTAFTTWSNIIQGHIEPSVGAEGYSLGDEGAAAAFTEYAAQGKAYDNSLIFFQLDDMDGVGHNQGFYTKKYYEQWKKTDQNVGKIYQALQANDLLEDTLVVLLPDHGGGTEKADHTLGEATSHGQDSPLAKTIFFAANGRTVATDIGKEKLLQGGSTKDLAATILTALGIDPKIGDSKVIDGMFVPQKDQNKADAPNMQLTKLVDSKTKKLNGYELSVDHVKSDVKAVDLELQTTDLKIKEIKSAQPGVHVLRSETVGGATRLVVTSESVIQADKPMIKLEVEAAGSGADAQLKQVMIADATGKEELPNLKNGVQEGDTEAPRWPSGSSLAASGITKNSVTLTWPSATDNKGVASYQIYESRQAMPLKTVSGSVQTTEITGLSSGTTYTFTVKAVDAANLTSEGLSKSVTTLQTGTTPTPSPTPTPAPTVPSVSEVKLNDLPIEVKPTKGVNAEGQPSIQVVLDGKQLQDAFSAQKQTVTVQVNSTEPVVEVKIPALTLLNVAKANPKAAIQIEASGARYLFPVHLIEQAAEGAQVSVIIQKVGAQRQAAIQAALQKQGVQPLLSNPIDFKLLNNGVEVTNFQGNYVERVLPLTSNVQDPSRATAVWVDEVNQLHFIPSIITNRGTGAEATIKSPHNSVYTVVQTTKSFDDLTGHWSKQDVELLAGKLILQGTSEKTFAPNAQITRAEFAALLVRALGLAEVKAGASFTDVKAADWYASVVETAYQAGLISGFEDRTFKPNANITREQMASMIMRAVKAAGKEMKGDAASLSTFTDQAKISEWAKKAVAGSLAAHLLQGKTAANFAPGDYATRAESATLLKRMLQFVQFIQ